MVFCCIWLGLRARCAGIGTGKESGRMVFTDVDLAVTELFLLFCLQFLLLTTLVLASVHCPVVPVSLRPAPVAARYAADACGGADVLPTLLTFLDVMINSGSPSGNMQSPNKIPPTEVTLMIASIKVLKKPSKC